ncbi:MAG TPA: FAD-dependent monooxygenase [Pyrinomonadaceae bacterium]|nr:FAD-dependent monooxygenase [Pyrinomonadaceae bacterium]
MVGAGPTGLALACQLIRYGIDFVIIDKKETTTPYSKAIGVQARTLELYHQIGLADELVALGTIAEGARLFVGGEIKGEIDFAGIGKGLSPYPFVLIVEQGRHERLLYDYINQHGHDVRWQHELNRFTQSDGAVTATVKNADGVEEEITAKYLIACDGAKSPVRHSLGLKFEGSTFERMFYVADVDIDWKYGKGGLFAFLMKQNLLVVFTMDGDNRYRIVGTFPEEFSKDEGDILYEEIEEQIRKDAEIKFDITKVYWFSTYNVHTRHVDKFSVGRVFLAGDAAHIHSPAGAQGMNTGIQDGYNLAWKLAWVLRGNSSGELLTTYNEERLPNAENLTRTTDRFFGLVADPNPFAAFVRLHIFPLAARFISRLATVRRFIFPRIAQLAINYRKSTLSRQRGNFVVKAGDRMPWLTVDGHSIYDDLREPLFHLVIFHGGRSETDPQPDSLLKEWEGKLDSHSYSLFPHVAKAFGCDKSFFLILRPDNYIGMISDDLSTERVREYLTLVSR